MRRFNTSGPCDPEKHYTVMRAALIAEGQNMVEQGRYFTLCAPRQSGKTTFFQLLLQQLKSQQQYLPLWVTFENLKTATREQFYHAFHHRLRKKLALQNIPVPERMTNQIELEEFFEALGAQGHKLVLVIDEFEGIPDCVLSEVMHTFRQMYHEKQFHGLHALLLVGVSTIAELVLSAASPFNIADELRISYFTFEDVQDLIQQYMAETHQKFDEAVIRAIYENTHGQPGLVNALCVDLVEKAVPEHTRPIMIKEFYPTLKYFLTRKFDPNLNNVVQKARTKKRFMLKVLFQDEPIPFSVHDENIAYLFANGVIDEVNDAVEVAVPLYSKVLITAFRPLLNGETDQYLSAHETIEPYLTPEGLNLNALLEKYRQYVRRRGFKAFDTEHLKEAAWHYSLDGFINFFIEQLGGHTFIETPSGRGRTDILIIYHDHKYIVETKIFTTNYYFQKGKGQLADYLKSEESDEGYYVVFSNKHTEKDTLYFEEEIKGKQIYTYIICTHFERPTDLPVPQELK